VRKNTQKYFASLYVSLVLNHDLPPDWDQKKGPTKKALKISHHKASNKDYTTSKRASTFSNKQIS